MVYTYTVTSTDGKVSRGEIESATLETAMDTLRRQGFSIVSIHAQEKSKSKLGGTKRTFFGKIKFYERAAFVDHLATMLKVGYQITDAVEVIYKDATNPLLKDILLQIKYNLEKGQTLSNSLAKYPKHFSSVFVNLIKAGEQSGTLEKALDHLALQLKKDYDLRKKVKSALVYPIFLLSFMVIVMLGMSIFILPRMTKMFEQSETELPWTTKLLVFISSTLSANIPVTLGVIGLSVFGLIVLFKSKIGKNLLYQIGMRLPVVKTLIKQVVLARFARTLSSLLSSGIGILEAVDLTADVLQGSAYSEIIRGSKSKLEKGISLNTILSHHPKLFPSMTISMISVGEKSGTLDEILKKVADFYEVEVDGSLKDLVTFLEPAMLFLIAIGVLFLALAIITPIYSLVSGIG